ncbi:MAG TPA: hypothetical protein ENF20_01560 [Candidatus Marinimicrobia bacterium]|nr:hypothetical protein [Candidatus Neomarinimicrobiota bacterium]
MQQKRRFSKADKMIILGAGSMLLGFVLPLTFMQFEIGKPAGEGLELLLWIFAISTVTVMFFLTSWIFFRKAFSFSATETILEQEKEVEF